MKLSIETDCCDSMDDGKRCEDASAYNPSRGLLAVADGMTHNSWMSGRFARFLVHHFISLSNKSLGDLFALDDPSRPRLWEEQLSVAWRGRASRIVDIELTRDENLRNKWLKGERKSRATFAGVWLDDDAILRLVIVGDCHVFVGVRNGGNVHHYTGRPPFQAVGDERTSSIAIGNGGLGAPVIESASVHHMDFGSLIRDGATIEIILATDAVGDWLESQRQNKPDLFECVRRRISRPMLLEWAAEEAEAGRLKSDDITLLLARYPA